MHQTSRPRHSLAAALGVLVLSGLSPAPSAAQPTATITFNEITPPATAGARTIGTPYLTQGYTFGCVDASTGAPCSSLSVLGTGNAAYTGSAALFNNNVFGITTLAREDGGAFDLLSLSMAPLFATAPFTGPVVFEGTVAGGGTATQTFLLAPPVGALTTYTFSGAFRGLVSVRFRGLGFGAAANTVAPVVDDIVVRQVATEVVPEPATVALLATGLLAVGGAAVRRRRATR